MRLTTVDHVGAAKGECLHASTEEKEAQLLGTPQMVAANTYHPLFHHEATIWGVCSICGRYCTVDANPAAPLGLGGVRIGRRKG